MPGRTRVQIPVLALTVLSVPAAAFAQGLSKAEDEVPRAAVQERKYGFSEEIRISVGSMPLDPFLKGWTGSLAYAHHFDELWAWEILQFTGALLTSTSLRDELTGTFGVQPEEFSAPRIMITTGAEFSPVYGKQVLFNQETVHGTMFFGIYGGVIFGDRPTFSETLDDWRPAIGGGVGFRLFLSNLFSTRFDGRLFASFRDPMDPEDTDESFDRSEADVVALLTLSLSLGFGGRP